MAGIERCWKLGDVAHPDRVSELVLFGVTTGRHTEFDWPFRGGLARFFPEQWERLLAALPEGERDGDVLEAFHRLLHDPDPEVCRRAAEASTSCRVGLGPAMSLIITDKRSTQLRSRSPALPGQPPPW